MDAPGVLADTAPVPWLVWQGACMLGGPPNHARQAANWQEPSTGARRQCRQQQLAAATQRVSSTGRPREPPCSTTSNSTGRQQCTGVRTTRDNSRSLPNSPARAGRLPRRQQAAAAECAVVAVSQPHPCRRLGPIRQKRRGATHAVFPVVQACVRHWSTPSNLVLLDQRQGPECTRVFCGQIS